MKIACINYQAVSLYRDQGWSVDRLANYYNPTGVAEKVIVAAYEEPEPFDLSESTRVVGYKSVDELRSIIFGFNPDVIRCYEANYPFCELALDISKSIGVPSYLSLHDSRKRYSPKLSGYTTITAYTETVQKKASSILGKEVELQLNGIDSKFFNPISIDPNGAFLDIVSNGIRSNYDFLIYTVGRIDPLSNIEVQVEAINIFRKASGIDAILVMSGPGLNEINWKEKDLDFVYAIGKTHQSVIRSIHLMSDCFMQVRIVPEISMAVTEALMMGVPVIHLGGEETSKKICWPIGLTVDSFNDPHAVADAIEFIHYNIRDARLASNNRRRMAIDAYDMDTWRKIEADRYRRLL